MLYRLSTGAEMKVMKVGDVVNFYTQSWVFADAINRYKNPGVIIKCSDPINKHVVAVVYWSDGKITREYSSYLELMEEEG
mgnify:CR=1 FL=1